MHFKQLLEVQAAHSVLLRATTKGVSEDRHVSTCLFPHSMGIAVLVTLENGLPSSLSLHIFRSYINDT